MSAAALTTKVFDGYKCLVCGVTCCSELQLEGHVAGKRHAHNVAFLEARGSERWRGDPAYTSFNFWNTVSELTPVYPCWYPDVESLLSTRGSLRIFDEPLRTQNCYGDATAFEEVSECPPEAAERNLDLLDETAFFSTFYQKKLPRDEFTCELCMKGSIIGRFCYIQHLKSAQHVTCVERLSEIDCDYFQPIRFPDSGLVFYVGLVSKTVVVYEGFFREKSRLLKAQWNLLDRIPTAESVIMQSTPEEAFNVFRCWIFLWGFW